MNAYNKIPDATVVDARDFIAIVEELENAKELVRIQKEEIRRMEVRLAVKKEAA